MATVGGTGGTRPNRWAGGAGRQDLALDAGVMASEARPGPGPLRRRDRANPGFPVTCPGRQHGMGDFGWPRSSRTRRRARGRRPRRAPSGRPTDLDRSPRPDTSRPRDRRAGPQRRRCPGGRISCSERVGIDEGRRASTHGGIEYREVVRTGCSPPITTSAAGSHRRRRSARSPKMSMTCRGVPRRAQRCNWLPFGT